MARGGFPGGGFGGGGNMQQLLRQAQKMQADMEKVQQELEETELEVSSGGGMVVSLTRRTWKCWRIPLRQP